MSPNNPDQDLPDRPDLRNEMSRVPFFFFSLITFACFAGGVYQYFIVKNEEFGQILFITGAVMALFTLVYKLFTSRVAKREK